MLQFNRFGRSEDGGIAIVFGLVIIVVVAVIGLAVDFGRASLQKTTLQGAVDASLLAGATVLTGDGDEIREAVSRAIDRNWTDKHPEEIPQLTFSEIVEGRFTVSARIVMPTTFMSVLGKESLAIEISSQVQYGINDAEVALVLDTTGSMSPHMAALREAANTLVDTLSGGSDNPRLKIGIVPFSNYVNVGMSYRDEPWMSVAPDADTPVHSCWNNYPDLVRGTCETLTGYNDGVPYQYEHCPVISYGDPVEQCEDWTRQDRWNGCVGSRANPHDESVVADAGSPYTGIVNATCGAPLTRLTSSISTIRDQIDALVPYGDTYIPAGALWGWSLLSHRSPFADGVDPATTPDVKKFMIVMSDGASTMYPDTPFHWGDTQPANPRREGTNLLTDRLCTKAKDEGVIIYTVSFDPTGDADVLSLMQSCASTPADAFLANDADELSGAFQQIGQQIVALRLTQ